MERQSGNKGGAAGPSARWARIGVLLLGFVVPQILLYGPSLTGTKVLLPLDLLFAEGRYVSPSANLAVPVGSNFALLDEVVLGIPTLEYAAKELRAGHIPLWNPLNFAGTPFATFPKYSPAFLIFCCWPHPITLAYMQLTKSVIAGLGGYFFFRRALGAGFWASAIGAWCYPLTGFFVQWEGYGLTQVVAWLPWILLAVNLTVREPGGFGPVLLAIFTGLALLAGQLDVAGLVLLSSGLYALACLVEVHGWHKWSRHTIVAAATLALGWGIGLCIATAYVAPLVEYSRTGERFVRRAAGEEERPPEGMAALPQIVLPNLNGSTQKGSLRIDGRNQLESSAAGYAGLLAALLLGPLGFCHRDLRARSFLWLGLLVLSVGWVAKLPGLIQLMRMPAANIFSWNRWMMLTGFAVTVLAVIGLDALTKGMVAPRPWFALPALLAAGVCGWCLYRMGNMPQVVLNLVSQAYYAPPNALAGGLPARQVAEMVYSYFRFWYGVGAGLGSLTLIGWGVLFSGMRIRGWMVALAGGLMLTELLIYGYNVNPQFGQELYYPRLAALEELKQRAPGRILCASCLPPDLNLMIGLPDIRGYDAVDPKRLLDLLELARAPGTPTLPYARTQWFFPWLSWTNDGALRVSPVLSMLNVRYLIWPQDLPSYIKTIIRRDGYDIMENDRALPRTFVPQTIRSVRDEEELINRLRDEAFDAGRVSYVTEPVDLPTECHGKTRIVEESSEKVILDARMDTAGMVVLADLWDKGWRANIDGQAARILVVNHAVRGLVVPAGEHQIVFRYEPDSVRIGWIVSGVALVFTVGWLTCIVVRQRKRRESKEKPVSY